MESKYTFYHRRANPAFRNRYKTARIDGTGQYVALLGYAKQDDGDILWTVTERGQTTFYYEDCLTDFGL